MSKQTIEVTVYNSNNGNVEDPPDNAIKYYEWLKDIINTIPEEHRSKVEINVESDYDTSTVSTRIFYFREETDEEVKLREERETKYSQQFEARERLQLALLKLKYEEDNHE